SSSSRSSGCSTTARRARSLGDRPKRAENFRTASHADRCAATAGGGRTIPCFSTLTPRPCNNKQYGPASPIGEHEPVAVTLSPDRNRVLPRFEPVARQYRRRIKRFRTSLQTVLCLTVLC